MILPNETKLKMIFYIKLLFVLLKQIEIGQRGEYWIQKKNRSLCVKAGSNAEKASLVW